MRHVGWFSLIVFMSAATVSAEEQGAIMGYGTTSCAEFAKEFTADPSVELTYFAWAQGLMSGMNMMLLGAKTEEFADLASEGLRDEMFQIRMYCEQHPLDSYTNAVVDLYSKDLKKVSTASH